MLKLSLIQKTQEFYHFTSDFAQQPDSVFVCPNPAIADSVRKRFDSLGKKVNSITISKFMKEELNSVFEPELLENYRGKSELIIILGAIWKKLGKSESYIEFKRAFNLLTEFRSFSTSEHVLETVLENYDEELSHGVLWLHRFLDQLDIIDEHRSYFLLSEKLREGDLDPALTFNRNIIFYGFDFLTGSQVDLFKALALRDDIIIPFYKGAYEKSIATDWINWFDEHNLEILDLSENIDSVVESELIRFSKGYLSDCLKIESSKFENIVLGTKIITREDSQEIPFDSLKTKVSVELFQECFIRLKHKLSSLDLNNMNLADLKKELLGEVTIAQNEKNYRFIKTILTFLNKVIEFSELSADTEFIDDFDLEVLLEATELDLPRINYSSISSKFDTTLCSVKDIEDLKNSSSAFCLSSNYQGLGASSHNYSESVEQYLASIGPVRRSELELEVLKYKILEFSQGNKVTFFIENNLLEHKTNISQMFSPIKFSQEKHLSYEVSNKFHHSLEKVGHTVKALSASRLQKYYECPKKYALTYLNKIMPFYQIPGELSVLDLGRIEHLVIETYFKKNKTWDEVQFKEIIQSLLEKYQNDNQLIVRDENLVEVISYTKETILTLIEFKDKLAMNFEFELPFNFFNSQVEFNGSIDLLAKGVGNQMIIDFKRSNSSFTSYQSLKDFEQIQLWFYLVRLIDLGRIDLEKDLMIGYIDLSNLENSLFLTNSKEFLAEIKSLGKINKIQVVTDFSELIDEYRKFEGTMIEKLISDQNFNPTPARAKSCNFCAISSICSKDGGE